MAQVHTVFDCRHEHTVEVEIEDDVIIPASVRGLGKCPACRHEGNLIAVAGIAPQVGGDVVLDTIMMMPM